MDTKTPKLLRVLYYWWWRTVETHQAVSRIHYGNGYKNRISNEHLAGDSDEFSKSIICYSSRVSDEWYRESKHSAIKIDEIASPKQLYIAPCRDSGQKAGRSRGSGNNE
jgi:hypothetical protein